VLSSNNAMPAQMVASGVGLHRDGRKEERLQDLIAGDPPEHREAAERHGDDAARRRDGLPGALGFPHAPEST
jgi:hypothetical protein